MGTHSRTPLLLGAVVLSLGALVAATSTGLGDPGAGVSVEERTGGADDQAADRGGSAEDGEASEARDDDDRDDERALPWLPPFDLVLTVVVALVFGLALATALRLRLLFRRRRAPTGVRPGVPSAPQDGEVEPAAEEVAGAVEHGLDLLDQGTPRNAIVAAWERLERAAVSERFAHRPADTPTEFVEHALSSYLLDAEAIGRLAARYREARFSAHPVTETHRAEARACLETLLRQLRREVRS